MWDSDPEQPRANLFSPDYEPRANLFSPDYEPRADLYPMDNERPQSAAPIKTNFPRLTLTTDYTMWRNAVECIIEVTGATIQQVVAHIISAMDGDTMYRAQTVLSDFKMTLRGQPVAEPINTIGDILNRMDRVLNKVGETDRAKLCLETLKQRPYETTADYFQECSNLWARANQGSVNRPEGQLISSFLGGLIDGTIARLARMRVREAPGTSANEVCNLVLSYEIGLREQDIEEKKKNDSTNHELMRNFDEVHRKELQALKFRNHQAGEPMDVDAIAAASRRRSIADPRHPDLQNQSRSTVLSMVLPHTRRRSVG
ncbi:Hypothetical protein FKW44_025108 [Caligus rogercresseyi]|uniref:Uncharacterized protein n=1 Tax=Caligus rogercresseyi TaxID=217165 RepID=A0A7T8GKU4_CALRO|nr:Hypothetical protein FKW44_025108 [Caligus rogercresseyi]